MYTRSGNGSAFPAVARPNPVVSAATPFPNNFAYPTAPGRGRARPIARFRWLLRAVFARGAMVFAVLASIAAVAAPAAAQAYLDESSLKETATFALDDEAWTARKEVPLANVALREMDGMVSCRGDSCAARAAIRDNDRPAAPRIAGIRFTSPTATYALGDEIKVSVVFDKPVTVTESPTAKPSLELDIGGTARGADYRSGSGLTALVFAYVVAEGDEDTDGLSIGTDRLTAPPETMLGPGGRAASLTHPAVRTDPTRKVDGIRPSALFATVQHRTVAVMWDEPLLIEDGLRFPDGLALVVGGVPRPIVAVAIGDRRVTLAADRTIEHGEWVTVSFLPPNSNPIRDFAGNSATGFALTVTAGERSTCQRTPTVRDRITMLLRHAVNPGSRKRARFTSSIVRG